MLYKPTDEERETIKRVYDGMDKMQELRDKTYEQFNNLTLKQFIDDGEKRLNAFVPSKESQGKAEWQSNVATQIIRNKLKAFIAGVASNPPEAVVKARNRDTSYLDIDRSYVMKNLIEGSYQGENLELNNYFLAWELAAKGTVINYCGYLKTEDKRKFIKSYDLSSGKVEYGEEEANIEDRCIDFLVPLTEFYIKDFYIFDVQDQPSVIWKQYYDEEEFKKEFGEYANYDKVKIGTMQNESEIETFYYKRWGKRTGNKKIEVIKYYSKMRDEYIIVANGVLMLEAPLLWEVNGKKVYPFAKSICEPFTDHNFFYGNSLPNILKGDFDVLNTLVNMSLDKTYRSMVPPLIVGRVNQDVFDLEDEILAGDTRIPVEDVNQIRELPISGINSADMQMINYVQRGIDLASVDPNQQGIQGSGVTAREVVIANQRATELKSLFYKFLTDLWRQKYSLRMANILMNYSHPQIILNKEGKQTKIWRRYVIEDAQIHREVVKVIQNQNEGILVKQAGILGAGAGMPGAPGQQGAGQKTETEIETVQGTLIIEFRDIKKEEERKKVQAEVQKEVEKKAQDNENIEIRIIPTSYLNDCEYQLDVIPESIHQRDLAKMQLNNIEKIQAVRTLFPEIFVANENDFFEQVIKAYDDDPARYLANLEKLKNEASKQQGAQQGAMAGLEAMLGGGGQGQLPKQQGGNQAQGELPAM